METHYDYSMDNANTSREPFSPRLNAATDRAAPPDAGAWQPVGATLGAGEPSLPLLIEQLQGALWTTDAQLILTSWLGPGFSEGSAPPAQVVGQRLCEVFGANDTEIQLVAAHQTAVQGAPATITLQYAGHIYGIYVEALRSREGTITGTVALARDITERVLAQQELRQAREELDRQVEVRTAELRHLYEQAQEAAVLQERQRLARDLHDAVTQMLFSASLIAEVLPRIWDRDADKARQHLEDLRMLTRGALAEMRTLLLELRPAALNEARLGDLLQQVAEALMGKIGVPVALTVRDARGREALPLPVDVRTTLYRVAQEALNNIAKHAEAHQVTIQLELQPGRADLVIGDDGHGFDTQQVTADHLGLGIMGERVAAIGGTLTVESGSGAGTRIRVQWQG